MLLTVTLKDNGQSTLEWLKKVPIDKVPLTVELWINQLNQAKEIVIEEHRVLLDKHFQKGIKEGEKWAATAEVETLYYATIRYTLNEMIDRVGSEVDWVQVSRSSPLLLGDYEDILDFFRQVFDQEEDYGLEEEARKDLTDTELEIYKIPNCYFRSFEDGWTQSVRAFWDSLPDSPPWQDS